MLRNVDPNEHKARQSFFSCRKLKKKNTNVQKFNKFEQKNGAYVSNISRKVAE